MALSFAYSHKLQSSELDLCRPLCHLKIKGLDGVELASFFIVCCEGAKSRQLKMSLSERRVFAVV